MGWRAGEKGEDVLWPYSRHSLNLLGGTDITTRTSIRVISVLYRFDLCTSRIRDGRVTSSAQYICDRFVRISLFQLIHFCNSLRITHYWLQRRQIRIWYTSIRDTLTWVYISSSGVPVPIRSIVIAADNAFDLRDVIPDELPYRPPPPPSLTHTYIESCTLIALRWPVSFVCTANLVDFTLKNVSFRAFVCHLVQNCVR